MSVALIVNHVFSFAIVMLCWWNAHLTASSREVLARVSSLAYGAVAVATLAAAFSRQMHISSEWVSVAYMAALAVLFLTIAMRKQARASRG